MAFLTIFLFCSNLTVLTIKPYNFSREERKNNRHIKIIQLCIKICILLNKSSYVILECSQKSDHAFQITVIQIACKIDSPDDIMRLKCQSFTPNWLPVRTFSDYMQQEIIELWFDAVKYEKNYCPLVFVSYFARNVTIWICQRGYSQLAAEEARGLKNCEYLNDFNDSYLFDLPEEVLLWLLFDFIA